MTSENNDFILELPSDEDLSTDKNRRVKSKESYPPKIHQDDGKDSKKTIMILGVVSIVIILIIAFLIFPINIDDLTDEEEDYTPVGGRIRHIDRTQFAFESLGPPSSADVDDVTITVFYGETEEAEGNIPENKWSLLDGDEVVAGSRFDINDLDDLEDIDFDEIEEIVIRIRGYSGTIDWQP